jgi:hypothetical protein
MGIDISLKLKWDLFLNFISCNFTSQHNHFCSPHTSASVLVLSWVHHGRTVHLVDRTTSSALSWLYHVTRSDVLSDVLSVLRRDGGQMEPGLGCMVGGSRQWNRGGKPLQSFMCLHFHVGGKPDTCQDEPFKYMSSILQHFNVALVLFIPHWHHLLTLHHFRGCNSETATGRIMKLLAKVQDSLIEWVQFSLHHYIG